MQLAAPSAWLHPHPALGVASLAFLGVSCKGKEASFITGMKPTENSDSSTPGPILLAGKAAGGVCVCAGSGEGEKVYTVVR